MKNNSFKRLLHYVMKYWYLIILSLLLTVVIVGLTLYIPILIGNAIDNLSGVNNVNSDNIFIILGKIIILIILIALFQWLVTMLNNLTTFKVIKDIRIQAFNKLSTLPLNYLDSHSHGELVNLIITDIQSINDGLLMGFNGFFQGILTIFGTIFFMIRINIWIAIIVIFLTPLSLFVARKIAKSTYSMFKRQAIARGEQTSVIEEMIGNVKTVQSLNKEDYAIKNFDKTNDELQICSLKATFYSSLTNPSTRFINALVYAFVGVGAALLSTITIGNLASLLSYANQYTKPFNEISGIITELQNALACASRVFKFIDEQDEVKDNIDAITLVNPKGNITLDHVSFSYSKHKKLIEDLNLKIKAGSKIAIVGPTGSGKTTLINLLMRFYDCDSGSILVDEINIKDIRRNDLRLNYGMILQDTWLRNDTVKNNLTLGDNSITMEEIIDVCKICHCTSFISRLPNTFDTLITEEGENLSTGQKQLLCIARVMLKKPKMLILDEATSNIDTKTEKKINDAFDKLMIGRTSFIVAHRLSTILSADCILVMKDGNIIEQGNHEELLSKNGFYTSLYNSQFSK